MFYLLYTFFITIPKLSIQLSPYGLMGSVITTVQLWWFVITRKTFQYRQDFLLHGRYKNTPFKVYLRYPMDIAVLREIFIDKEYEWVGNNEPKTIIDLGAHFGDTALYYHARYPEATIIAVEPSPENYERLVKNTKDISQIIPVQAAVGKVDGVINLSLGTSALGYSTLHQETSENSIQVSQVTLHTLLKNNSIEKADLIKFDIEGAEFDVFYDTSVTRLSKAFVGEVHTDLVPGSTLQNFFALFKAMKCESTTISAKGRYVVQIQE